MYDKKTKTISIENGKEADDILICMENVSGFDIYENKDKNVTEKVVKAMTLWGNRVEASHCLNENQIASLRQGVKEFNENSSRNVDIQTLIPPNINT